MNAVSPQKLKLKVDGADDVSALLLRPPAARACFVFAHGAGAGMTHQSMETVAAGLSDPGVAPLRYQFPYMENGSRRPDAPVIAHPPSRATALTAPPLSPHLALLPPVP